MSIKNFPGSLSLSDITQVVDPLLDKKGDIFSLEYNNDKIWVKKAKGCSSNLLHHLAYKIFKNPIFVPVKKQTAAQSIIHEASKLKKIKEVYDNVPEVLEMNERYMVTCDSGRDVRSYIDNVAQSEDEIKKIIYDAFELLSYFHTFSFYHGGSQIKNFTIKNGKISMIDFEEDFEGVDLKDLQFRDLFLFLISVARLNINIDFKEMINKYIDITLNKDIFEKFDSLIKDIGFVLRFLDNEFILSKMDKDTKSVYKLLTQLKTIGENN